MIRRLRGEASLADLQQGAGIGVLLGKEQEIKGKFPGKHNEIGLRVARAHAGGVARDLLLPDQGAYFGGGGVLIVCHDFSSFFSKLPG